jgi:hypothetical protein
VCTYGDVVKRYSVEVQESGSSVWEIVHYTDSLPVAKRYADSMANRVRIGGARVIDGDTGRVCYVGGGAADVRKTG